MVIFYLSQLVSISLNDFLIFLSNFNIEYYIMLGKFKTKQTRLQVPVIPKSGGQGLCYLNVRIAGPGNPTARTAGSSYLAVKIVGPGNPKIRTEGSSYLTVKIAGPENPTRRT
jgi:hypothetical protein